MKKFGWSIAILVLAIFILIAAAWSYVYFAPIMTKDDGYVYYLKPASSKSHVLADFTEQGVIKHPMLFSLYIYTHPNDHLKTGEYLFPKGASLASVWKQITTGTGLYYRPFAIIPGWSFTQLRKELAKTDTLNHITANMTDQQIMAQLGKADLFPEGQFYPETYYYTRGNPDLVILKRAFDLMQKRLEEAWLGRASNLPYKNAYDALIVASLVEKEAKLATERPIIAGVIINRLQKNMLLQIDPTIIYGMGDRYDGKIYKENIHEDTPYNTYVHKGLPPTPIAMPSIDSIKSALHPEMHDYYYFVAKGDGSHQFSKSLPEHNEAVKTAIKKEPQAFYNDARVEKYLIKLLHINV